MIAAPRYVGYRSLPLGRHEVTLELDGITAKCQGKTPVEARAACMAALAEAKQNEVEVVFQ